MEKGARDRAAAAFVNALSHTPVPAECLKITGDCYKGRPSGIRPHLYQQSLDRKKGFLEALLGLALCRHHQGQPVEAARLYKEALELKPDCLEAQLSLADLFYEQGMEEAAQAFYEQALRSEPRLIQASLRLAGFAVKRER